MVRARTEQRDSWGLHRNNSSRDYFPFPFPFHNEG